MSRTPHQTALHTPQAILFQPGDFRDLVFIMFSSIPQHCRGRISFSPSSQLTADTEGPDLGNQTITPCQLKLSLHLNTSNVLTPFLFANLIDMIHSSPTAGDASICTVCTPILLLMEAKYRSRQII